MCRTEVLPSDFNNQAKEFTDFLPLKEKLKFEHGETEKKIQVPLEMTADITDKDKGDEEQEEKRLKDSDSEESESEEKVDSKSLIFQLKLDEPSPEGTKISKRNICFIEIVPDEEEDSAAET